MRPKVGKLVGDNLYVHRLGLELLEGELHATIEQAQAIADPSRRVPNGLPSVPYSRCTRNRRSGAARERRVFSSPHFKFTLA